MSGTQGSSYSSSSKASTANKTISSNIKSGKNASGSAKAPAKTISSNGNKSVNAAAAAAAKTLATKTAKANYGAYGNAKSTSSAVKMASGLGGSTNRSSVQNPISAGGKGNYGLVNSAPGKGNLPSGGGLFDSVRSGANSLLASAKGGLLNLANSYSVPTFGSLPTNGILSAPKPQNGLADYNRLGYMTAQAKPSIGSIVAGDRQQQYAMGGMPGEIGALQQKDILGRDGIGDIVNAMLSRATVPKQYTDRVPSGSGGVSVASREPIGYDSVSARYDQQQSNFQPKSAMPATAYAALTGAGNAPSVASVPAIPGTQSPMSGQGTSFNNPYGASDYNTAMAQSLGRQPRQQTQMAAATVSPMSGQGSPFPSAANQYQNKRTGQPIDANQLVSAMNAGVMGVYNRGVPSAQPVQAASNDPIENPLYEGDSTPQQKLGGYLEQKAEKYTAPFANVAEKINTALGGSPYNDLYGSQNQQTQNSGYSWSSENMASPIPGKTSPAGQYQKAAAQQQQAATIWDSFTDTQRDQLATLEPAQITQVRQYMQQGMSFAEAFAKVKPATTNTAPTWRQPQYTQTWAFTPAGPTNA